MSDGAPLTLDLPYAGEEEWLPDSMSEPVAIPGKRAQPAPRPAPAPKGPQPRRYDTDGANVYDTAGARHLIAAIKKIGKGGQYRPYECFRRWVELADAAARAGGRADHPAEAEYLRLAAWFDKDQLDAACEALAVLWESSWESRIPFAGVPDFRDHLGLAYMAICGADKFNGQYFTPFPIAKMMAEMLAGPPEEVFAYTPAQPMAVCDPACGSGVMFLAHASAMPWRALQEGRVAYYGMDNDAVCAHMARLNLWARGLNRRWPEELIGTDALDGRLDPATIAAAREAAPHGKLPPEAIERASCPDFAAVDRALATLDGAHLDPASAPPAPRVAKARPAVHKRR